MERGVYREELFNGVVEYHIFDSNGLLICKSELIKGHATDLLESRMADWLDMVDPVEPKGGLDILSPSVAASLVAAAASFASLQGTV